jgi:hypothetical protein
MKHIHTSHFFDEQINCRSYTPKLVSSLKNQGNHRRAQDFSMEGGLSRQLNIGATRKKNPGGGVAGKKKEIGGVGSPPPPHRGSKGQSPWWGSRHEAPQRL